MLPILSLACLALVQESNEDLAVLLVGEPIRGEIEEGDPVVRTAELDQLFDYAQTVGQSFAIFVDEPGIYHIDMRSDLLDAYLVLRDWEGRLLDEDDDGLVGTHARIVARLAALEEYVVEACAVKGQRGPFELSIAAGRPRDLTPEERVRSNLEEADRQIAAVERTFGPEHASTATAIENKAWYLEEWGDWAAARPLFERALAIREKALGPNAPQTALSLYWLGRVHYKQGHLAEAQALFERALATWEEVLGPESLSTLRALNSLAAAITDQGDYARARPIYERSLATRERILGPSNENTATALNDLARLLSLQGDYVAARPLFERALAIRESRLGLQHRHTATTLNNLSRLHEKLGEYGAAQSYCERALAIWEKTLGPEHPDTARSIHNLAVLLHLQGKNDAARPLHAKALAIREKVLEAEAPDVATSLTNLGLLLQSEGAAAAARPLLEKGLTIRERVLGPEHPDTIASLVDFALLLTDVAEPAEALPLVQRAWNAGRARARLGITFLSEAENYQYLALARKQLEAFLSLTTLLPGLRSEAHGAELAWKGQVTRGLLASRAQILAGLSDDQRRLVEQLRRCQSQLSSLAFVSDIGDPGQLEEEFASVRQQRNQLELELERSTRVSLPEDVSPKALKEVLPHGSALVDFLLHQVYRPARRERGTVVEAGHWSEPRLSVWITRPTRTEPVRLDLGPATEIEAATKAFLQDLVSRRGIASRDSPDPVNVAERLRPVLWDPIAAHLAGVRTVFVSPDGFLGTLPFETLRLEDGSFLVEHYGFVYLQDPTALAHSRSKPVAPLDSLLSAGGIDYRLRAAFPGQVETREPSEELVLASASVPELRGTFADYWAPLRHTSYESTVVASLHEDSFRQGRRLLLQGAEATEERFKRELPGHAVLHIATHGFFNPEGLPSLWDAAKRDAEKQGLWRSEEGVYLAGKHPGLLTGLVCAGANVPPGEGRDDGYLTAEEVGWLDLSQVELVVLSACETGLGRSQSGEGLVGLRRAFELAGAKTVISSLWSVKDESTSRLMQSFYQNLWQEEMSRAEALRSAQLEMLARNRAEQGDPLPATWGAFVLSGEWR